MAKYLITRTDTVGSEFIVEAESKDEALDMAQSGEVNASREKTIDRDWDIEEYKEEEREDCKHSWIDKNNDGQEECRLCGEIKEERSCVKCGKTSGLIEEDMCYTCAKERGRV